MALKINRKLQNVLRIIGWVVLAVLIVCMIKTFVWEHNYYNTKSGETRARADLVITKLAEAENPSEDEPDLASYQVEATKPRYLSIERLGIKTRVKESTVNSEVLAVPQNIHDVMWAAGSSRPSQGGVILMSGLSRGETKDGAFANLDSLEKEDKIEIELGNGDKYNYTVSEIRIVDASDAENELPSIQRRIDDKETLSLVTAIKKNNLDNDYSSIVIVRAVLNS